MSGSRSRLSPLHILHALFLFTIANITANRIVPDAGEFPTYNRTAATENRIVGGNLAAPGQSPHLVSMRIKKHDFHFCGGSIIGPHWIVTAAHCTNDFKAPDIEVVAGTMSLISGGVRYDVAQIVQHELYIAMIIRNDISLLRTTQEIAFGDTVHAIPLCTKYTPANVPMRLTGWGLTSYPGNVSLDLRTMDVMSINNFDCALRLFGSLVPPISFVNNICAVPPKGEGACKGDSGGGLVTIADNELCGVVSWGVPCAKNKPDMYTRVFSYLNWIKSNMGKET